MGGGKARKQVKACDHKAYLQSWPGNSKLICVLLNSYILYSMILIYVKPCIAVGLVYQHTEQVVMALRDAWFSP